MPLTSKKAKEMARQLQGNKLVCTIKNGRAICVFNQRKYLGFGKSNYEAFQAVFKKINLNIYESRDQYKSLKAPAREESNQIS